MADPGTIFNIKLGAMNESRPKLFGYHNSAVWNCERKESEIDLVVRSDFATLMFISLDMQIDLNVKMRYQFQKLHTTLWTKSFETICRKIELV